MLRAQAKDPEIACLALAAEHFGCISLEQARALGLSSDAVHRRVRSGLWKRPYPRTFVVAGSSSTWRQRLMAGCLSLGKGAAVAGRAAAAVWRFPDIAEGDLEFVTKGRNRRLARTTIHHVTSLPRHEVALVGRLPVTTPTRTLLDISSTLGDEQLEVSLHFALFKRLTNYMRLSTALDARKGRRGVAVLRNLLELYAECPRPAQSPHEVRVMRALRSAKDLPPFERQFPVQIDDRRVVIDFALPSAKIAIEADSYRWHSSRPDWRRDRNRLNGLLREEWELIFVADEDVRDSSSSWLEDVRSLIQKRLF